MDYAMTVYESEDALKRNPADTERFERSYAALESVGIHIRRVMCSSADDIDTDGEAKDIVEALKGQGLLALTAGKNVVRFLYERVSISVGEYPSDQDLADFLNPPDGTLSVDSQKPPSMGNDLMPACNCGQKKR